LGDAAVALLLGEDVVGPTATTAVAAGGVERAAWDGQSGVAFGSAADVWLAGRCPQPARVSTAMPTVARVASQ
jgi:hypothetical protein